MNGGLTDRQARILRCIRDHIIDTGESPSVRQIGALVGLSSSSSVAYQLGRLEERGLISRTGRHWRNIHMT
ncbi:MarR family transcriptional regulator [Streptomyces sp. NBC_01760]|uniref:LexA family protein n=1 Tax=Streptomyces sp. NBC_01760 TaxID=2975931 RepID=UPI002DD9C104|nr:MarR family transcriptional regulator [Streptomyces sp. NBC_01760]WSC72211.1 MarR family transcriptional regulator [Streptomyces sp. NBC_01760]